MLKITSYFQAYAASIHVTSTSSLALSSTTFNQYSISALLTLTNEKAERNMLYLLLATKENEMNCE